MTSNLPDFLDAQALLDGMKLAAIGHGVSDRQGKLLYADRCFTEHLGLPLQPPFGGVPWFHSDGAPDEFKQVRTKAWEEFLQSGTHWQGVVKWFCGDETIRYIEGTAIPHTDEYVLLVSNDRTNRVVAGRKARETQRLQSTAIEALPVFVCVVSRSFKIEYLNDFLPNRLNKPKSLFIGRSVERIFGIDVKESAERIVSLAADAGEPTSHEVVKITNGRLANTYWSVQATPLWNKDGQIDRVLMIAQDKTDSVKLRDERIMFANMTYETQKIEAINSFAGSMAHELSNLLQPISGYSQILTQEIGEPNHQEYLAKINQAALTAGRILRRTLSMSRTDMPTEKTSDLTHIVSDTVGMARDLAPKGLTYAIHEQATGLAACPPGELRQVLLNLLNNAAESMHYLGEIEITLDRQLVGPEGAGVVISGSPPFLRVAIKDQGGGMPPQVRSRIFEPFFTTKPVGRGTGLGLPIVQGLAIRWGGIVTVDDNSPDGSTFNIWIPEDRTPKKTTEG